MTAAAALLCLIFLSLISGCHRHKPSPAPSKTPTATGTPTASPSASATPTASATASESVSATASPSAWPTPVPLVRRQFPCVSATLVGQVFDYTAKKRESLHSVSAKYGVDSRVIAEENDLSRETRLKPGQTVLIDNRHIAPCDIGDGILVNLPQRMLFFYQGGKLATSYPVAVGRPTWPTPTGGFQVLRLKKDPVWVVPQSIQDEMELKGKVVKERVPPGPQNPLGDYWIGLSIPGIGIHATNAPVSIYSYRTHGCIRLQPDNAKDLFGRLTPDTPGMIIYEPVLFASTADGKVFLEVDLDIYKEGGTSLDDVRRLASSAGITNLIDWNRAAAIVKNRDGLAHEVGAKK